MAIQWATTRADARLIASIVSRADKTARDNGHEPIDQLAMDIIACHNTSCTLALARLLKAGEFNFVHDVWGIHKHIDRTTGQLTDCFLPRFSA